mgnify:CR=1 FL=1
MGEPDARTTGRKRWGSVRAGLGTFAVAAGVWGCSGGESELKTPVYPVKGSVTFEGEPAAGAFVVFHPRIAPKPGDAASSPRATVQADGAFALTTAVAGDGAPAGDYAVTVQWMKPVKRGGELVPGPNVLPRSFAEAASTPLTASIHESDNALQPFAITRK